MEISGHGQRTPRYFLFSIFSFLVLGVARAPGSAQEQEVVANLAAGRVEIYVARDSIAIGALENRVESETRPPVVVPLSSRRIGVLLGAVEWALPGSGRKPVRLDRDLPRLFGEIAGAKRLEPEQASDIEGIGVALLEPLRAAAQQLHRKIEILSEEPLVELLLVGYVEEYGPEVWLLRYRIVQEPLRGDYWQTRVLRPSYTQLYPPEQGRPHTLLEVRYPPGDAAPALLDLLNQNDPRLAQIRSANLRMARAVERLARGESHKAALDDASEFLRAALGALAHPEAKTILGVIAEQRGFQWLLPPAELPEKAEEAQPREPGAPSLRKKP
jgi:hypothetical protein